MRMGMLKASLSRKMLMPCPSPSGEMELRWGHVQTDPTKGQRTTLAKCCGEDWMGSRSRLDTFTASARK